MFRGLFSTAILLVFCVGSSPHFALAGDDIDLDMIKRRLEEWRGAFVNLRMDWELRSLKMPTQAPLPEWALTADPHEFKLFSRNEWIWADHGLDLLEHQDISSRDGKCHGWDVQVFNGPKSVVFRANYAKPSEGAESLKELSILGLGVGKPISSIERTPTRGLYWPGGAEWLPELLSKWQWTLEGFEEIGGARCARVSSIDPDPRVADVQWIRILWLDLDHDCLVRRYLSPAIPKRRSGMDSIVDEFQQLENGNWFPKRGRMQLHADTEPYENQLWEVTEVAVNQPLDLKRFEPPAPQVGTLVSERGKTYTHGAPRVGRAAGDPSNEAGEQSSPSSPVRSAKPPASGWYAWSGGLLMVSLICMIVGFWFWRRT